MVLFELYIFNCRLKLTCSKLNCPLSLLLMVNPYTKGVKVFITFGEKRSKVEATLRFYNIHTSRCSSFRL